MTQLTVDTETAFAEIVDDLTRRGFLAGGLTAAAVLGLAACGSDDTAGSTPRGAAKTRAMKTVYGTVDLPANPQKILPFDFPEACALLDLGMTPLGRPTYMPAFPAYTTALTGVPTIDDPTSGDLDLEKIASLAPDLIVGDDWADPKQQRQPYPKLSAIAPTAIFEWQQAAGNWPDLAAQTAQAVGRSKQLDALKKKYDDTAASIKQENAAVLSAMTWDLIDCGKDQWDLYSAASSHGGVLTAAGVVLGAGGRQSDGYKQYSLEQLGLLGKTDVIVTTPDSLPFLKKQRIFAGLPAVKAGRVYTTTLFFPASYGIAQALLADLATFVKGMK